MQLDDRRIALVTGASRGIGRAVVLALAARGVRLAALARSTEGLDALAAETRRQGVECLPLACDVGSSAAVERAVGQALDHFGRIDLVVNNAGIGSYHPFLEASLEEFSDLMRVNYFGTLHVTRAVLPAMLARREGHLAFIASIAGRIASPRHTAYSPTKFAVVGFAEALAYEVTPYGVGVTIVNPGTVDTAFFDQPSFADFPPGPRAMMIPPTDVAAATVRAIERNTMEIFVPGRLKFPHVFKAIFPRLFRAGAMRYARAQGMIPAAVPRPRTESSATPGT